MQKTVCPIEQTRELSCQGMETVPSKFFNHSIFVYITLSTHVRTRRVSRSAPDWPTRRRGNAREQEGSLANQIAEVDIAERTTKVRTTSWYSVGSYDGLFFRNKYLYISVTLHDSSDLT